MAMVSPVAEQLHNHNHHTHMTEQMINFKLKERKQLSLENYLSFLQSADSANFTANQLNMIISIHGFKKVSQRKKAEEALKQLEPIDAARSTLTEDISSSIKANMDFNEAIKDLKALNWQECSITSFKSIKPENDKLVLVSPSTATTTKSGSLKAKKKPKLASSMISSGSVPNDSGGSGTSQSLVPVFPSATATKMRKTVKRQKLASLTESSCSGPSIDSGSASGGCSSSSLSAGGGKRGGGKKMLHAIVCLGAN
ncbi:uncharacterized protein LOC110685892 isoform X1 [Chenopodium quinoa]|uniref:uncharacterized protein LOC110685892 isoform X1 n=1 Tax=Chenopodium quinoa TaxID=63459 RepID=UPI000B77E1EC|nr:uncharacterized protein LOC110685892 isoform X1 [Chenopodium quinoa]